MRHEQTLKQNYSSETAQIDAAVQLLHLHPGFPMPGKDAKLNERLDGIKGLDLSDIRNVLHSILICGYGHFKSVGWVVLGDLLLPLLAKPYDEGNGVFVAEFLRNYQSLTYFDRLLAETIQMVFTPGYSEEVLEKQLRRIAIIAHLDACYPLDLDSIMMSGYVWMLTTELDQILPIWRQCVDPDSKVEVPRSPGVADLYRFFDTTRKNVVDEKVQTEVRIVERYNRVTARVTYETGATVFFYAVLLENAWHFEVEWTAGKYLRNNSWRIEEVWMLPGVQSFGIKNY